MWIIVGLGNPGREYENTRHNIGFAAVELLAQRNGIAWDRSLRHSVYGKGAIAGEAACVLKPTTYMNRSGYAVSEALSWWKRGPQALIVLLDEVDLPLGSLRIREKGSAGSHNGLASVIEQLGDDRFVRVRLGIGAPAMKRMDLADFVLGRFSGEEGSSVADMTQRAAEAVECCLREGIKAAMAKYNRKAKPAESSEAEDTS